MLPESAERVAPIHHSASVADLPACRATPPILGAWAPVACSPCNKPIASQRSQCRWTSQVPSLGRRAAYFHKRTRCCPDECRASASGTPIHPRPINPPPPARYRHPNKMLQRCPTRMVVEHGCSFIETASVPRIGEAKLPIIEMVAEFVTKRTQKSSEGSDLFPHRCSHPDSDHHGFGSVVSEKFCRPLFTNSQRSGGKYADAAIRDSVELQCSFQKFGTGASDPCNLLSLHCRLDGLCDCRQGCIIRQVQPREPVTLPKASEIRVAWRSVGEHG